MKIIKIRKKLGLSQVELSKLVNVCHVTIAKIEKGNIDTVNFGILKKIAKVLNTTVQDLFLSDEE